MSALTFKRTGLDRIEGPCQVPGCNARGRMKVEILGYPCGKVCQAHRRQWEASWEGALDSEPVAA